MVILLFLCVLALVLTFYSSATTTTVVVVRATAGLPGSIADPPLLPEEEARAQALARIFADGAGEDGRIEAIYVMPGRRTQQIAAPLAGRLGLAPQVITESDVGDAAASLLGAHRGRAVLVVTTASSVTRWVEVLSGIRVAAAANGGGANLYVVSIPSLGSPGLLQLRY